MSRKNFKTRKSEYIIYKRVQKIDDVIENNKAKDKEN